MIEFFILLGGATVGALIVEYRYGVTKKRLQDLENQNKNLSNEILDLTRLNAALEAQVEHNKELHKKLLDDYNLKFELLSKNVIEKSTNQITSFSEQTISSLVRPLAQRLFEFNQRIDQIHSEETKEMFSLKNEIANIVKINHQISNDANNLTKALKGDVKFQGNWGELILERVLEASGLRINEEYYLQSTLIGDNGETLRPDVLIRLPEDKYLVVDSKVTLVSYEQFISAKDETEKDLAIKEFKSSFKKHIDGIATKKYEYNQQLNSPEFVIIFVPIEGAFSFLIQKLPDLIEYGWGKRVVVVGPTSLVATLKTVASVWRVEKQNQNAEKIARESGLLYDKIVAFVDDLLKIGEGIEKIQDSYQKSLMKLKDGKGNILSKIESIKDLGAKVHKQLDQQITGD